MTYGEHLPPSTVAELLELLKQHPPLPEHPTPDEATLLLEDLLDYDPTATEDLTP